MSQIQLFGNILNYLEFKKKKTRHLKMKKEER